MRSRTPERQAVGDHEQRDHRDRDRHHQGCVVVGRMLSRRRGGGLLSLFEESAHAQKASMSAWLPALTGTDRAPESTLLSLKSQSYPLRSTQIRKTGRT